MDSNTVQACIFQALLSQQLTFKIAKFEVRLELLEKYSFLNLQKGHTRTLPAKRQ